jgi:tetratricopeptide (TPR) repeat protein
MFWARAPSFRAYRQALLTGGILFVIIAVPALLAAPHVWGEWHFRAAQRNLSTYHLAEAREHLRQCLRVWPRSGRVHLLAARAARQAYDYEAADRFLIKSQRLIGSQTEDIVLERMLIRAQLGEVDAVMPYLRSLVEGNHSDSVLILEAMAWGCLQQLRVQEAAFFLRLLREREPDNVRALIYEGWARELLDVTDDALEDYRRALELEPDNLEVRMRLANCLLEANRSEDALEHFLILKQKFPGNEMVRTRLGRCYYAMGQFDEARRVLDELLAEQPRCAAALTARARLAVQEHDNSAAEAWLRTTLRLEPASYPAQYLLFQCLEQQGKQEQAQAAKQRMDQMKADLARIHDIISVELGRSPRDPDLYYEAGLIMIRAGDHREAVKWLTGALRHDPRHAKAHAALMQLYQHDGDTAKAAYHRDFVPADMPVVPLPFQERDPEVRAGAGKAPEPTKRSE